MTLFAYLALLGWIPLGITMFAVVPARKAVAFIVVGGLLILPPYTLDISGLPDYSRIMAASISVILGTVIFAPDRFLNFRPRWFDLPMLAWCFSSMASSLYNGLGVYDGLAATLSQVLTWGLPYLIGRIYFGNPEDLRYFAVAVVIGGLAYVLPCLYEVRMSPKLMKDIYGISQLGAIRFGGCRPTVFFWTGLELGMWMTATSLVAWWLWYCGALKQIGSIPLGSVLLPTLLGTSFLCRSTGALITPLRGPGPAVGVDPTQDAAAAGRTHPGGARVRLSPPLERVDRPAGRGHGQFRLRPGSCAVAGIPLHVRELARRQGHAAADVRLGRVGPRHGFLR